MSALHLKWTERLVETSFSGGEDVIVQEKLDALICWLAGVKSSETEAITRAFKNRDTDKSEAMQFVLVMLDPILFRPENSPWATLGLRSGADPDHTKKRYHRLTKIYHPDRALTDESWLNKRSERINTAYELIKSGKAASRVTRSTNDKIREDSTTGVRLAVSTIPINARGAEAAFGDWVRKSVGSTRTIQRTLLATMVIFALLIVSLFALDQPQNPTIARVSQEDNDHSALLSTIEADSTTDSRTTRDTLRESVATSLGDIDTEPTYGQSTGVDRPNESASAEMVKSNTDSPSTSAGMVQSTEDAGSPVVIKQSVSEKSADSEAGSEGVARIDFREEERIAQEAGLTYASSSNQERSIPGKHEDIDKVMAGGSRKTPTDPKSGGTDVSVRRSASIMAGELTPVPTTVKEEKTNSPVTVVVETSHDAPTVPAVKIERNENILASPPPAKTVELRQPPATEVLVPGASESQGSETNKETELLERKVRFFLTKYTTLFESGENQRLMALYLPDARQEKLQGRDHIRKYYERLFKLTELREIEFRVASIDSVEDHYKVIAPYNARLIYRGGNEESVDGTAVFRIRRQDADLVIQEAVY